MLICFRANHSRKHLLTKLRSTESLIFRPTSSFTASKLAFCVSRRASTFDAGKHGAGDEQHARLHRDKAAKREGRAAAYEGYLPKSCIPSQPQNPDSWLDIIEPTLPGRLRVSHQDFIKEETFTEYLPKILVRARRAYSVDILSYLGLQKGRWRAVVWLVKEVIDRTFATDRSSISSSKSSGVQWCFASAEEPRRDEVAGGSESCRQPWPFRTPLGEISTAPIWLEKNEQQPYSESEPLHVETDRMDTMTDASLFTTRKSALGQVWRSLGSMVLAAAAEQDPSKSSIMPFVLEILAHMHHVGMISDSVYEYPSTLDDYVLKQPPLLHILSSRILTAISDAAWQAHELHVQEEKRAAGAQYTFLGHEIPGSRYRVRPVVLGTQVWLELILWSCLHGGWVEDGAAILQAAYEGEKKCRWRLICWQDVLAQQRSGDNDTIDWSNLDTRIDVPLVRISKQEQRKGRIRVERTISSEVVIAYIDALMSAFRVGVGNRGISAGVNVQSITKLKDFLNVNHMNLGAAAWDALIVRLVESQGINLEEDPGFMNHILERLSPVYGDEHDAQNARAHDLLDPNSPTYVFDSTAVILGFYHRVLRAFITRGDVDGAFRTFVLLQDYTDRNKQKAFKQLGRILRDKESAELSGKAIYSPNRTLSLDSSVPFDDTNGDSSAANVETDFTAFYPRMSNSLSGALIDLITASKAFNFGTYLISSQDIDGPTLPPSTYCEPSLAGPLIRFATATQDRNLLVQIVDALRNSHNTRGFSEEDTSETVNQFLPEEVILTFLENQIRNRKWEAVESLLEHIRGAPDLSWTNVQLAQLAREMLLHHPTDMGDLILSSDEYSFRLKPNEDLQHDENARSLLWATHIFLDLVKGRWGRAKIAQPATGLLQLNSLLGLLADLGYSWAAVVKSLRKFRASQRLDLPFVLFNPVLEGVVGARGAAAGIQLIDKWCGEFRLLRPYYSGNRDANESLEEESESKGGQNEEEVRDSEKDKVKDESQEDTSSVPCCADDLDDETSKDAEGTKISMEPTSLDEDLIQTAGGVAPVGQSPWSLANRLEMKPIRVEIYEELGVTISFRGRSPSNFLTLRIILRAAHTEWNEMEIRWEEGNTIEDGTEEELKAVFEWIRNSFRKLGMEEDQIAKEVEGV
ncbi:MAG: hypothetical protein Q9157_002537 [Trypethelium eluteriae]